MANSHDHNRRNIPHIKLPKFEPLPPDVWYNRLINNMLKPIFYLFFVMITSIIVVPIFTIIENLKDKQRASSGHRSGSHTSYTMNGQPVESSNGKAESFLNVFGASYGHGSSKDRQRSKSRHRD